MFVNYGAAQTDSFCCAAHMLNNAGCAFVAEIILKQRSRTLRSYELIGIDRDADLRSYKPDYELVRLELTRARAGRL